MSGHNVAKKIIPYLAIWTQSRSDARHLPISAASRYSAIVVAVAVYDQTLVR
jgi:hypothetical protein